MIKEQLPVNLSKEIRNHLCNKDLILTDNSIQVIQELIIDTLDTVADLIIIEYNKKHHDTLEPFTPTNGEVIEVVYNYTMIYVEKGKLKSFEEQYNKILDETPHKLGR